MLKALLLDPLELCEGRLNAPIWLTCRRFARCRSGISSVEFVIVLPILMLFLFGIITFATTLYIQVNMENAAREGARRMAVAEAGGIRTWVPCTSVQATTAGTAENYACIYLADWPISFEVYAEPGCPPASPTDRNVRLTVSVNAEAAALADVFGFFSGKTLTAKVVMRKEAPCV